VKLSEWIKSKGFTQIAAANFLYVCRQTIYNWVKYNKKPTGTMIRRVKQLTKGLVTEKDWV